MPASTSDDSSVAKGKRSANPLTHSISKRSRTQDATSPSTSLIGPHESIIAQLSPKYDVLALSVISSTQIRKRITSVTKHLISGTTKPRVALLYARTADVCKLITVVEHCKRVLRDESKVWHQYNQLFDLPDGPKKRDVVEETILQKEVDEDEDSDDFEVMQSRIEDAVLPLSTRTIKSMRVFISIAAVPELKSKQNITLQFDQGRKA